MRVVSGIQPTGYLHLGNYFGAIRQFQQLQDDHECFFFIVDYHAMTHLHDADLLRRYRRDAVCAYLALGLDPYKATLFVQSDVPQVLELAWILSTVTPMGLLQRAHAYKDRVSRGLPADHGLFAYPVLMAADILLYGGELVPVGRDQKQHLEMTRDIAQRFNGCYGRLFEMPEAHMMPLVPGTDGRKMSKSYDNTIGIFDDPEVVEKKVMTIPTDSKAKGEPRDPEACALYGLFKLFVAEKEAEAVEAQYRDGSVRYHDVKLRLIDLIRKRFERARKRIAQLQQRPQYVRDVLEAGRERAGKIAEETMQRVRKAVGI